MSGEDRRQYCLENTPNVIGLIKELCGIPAPSNHEEARARFCRDWMRKAGFENAYIDTADNAVCSIGAEDGNEVVLLTAHTDTVFPDTKAMPLYEKEGKLYSPGVGDDTANLAVLLYTARYFLSRGVKSGCGVVFAANSGEEGLGNLRGIRRLMEDYKGRVKEMVSFDGGYAHICNKAVGSTRYRISLRTEGGHSYSDFGNRNAIHVLSSLISLLYTVKVPAYAKSKTTYNVGAIRGGTSVNSIAEDAEILYEYRSDERVCLEKMKQIFEGILVPYKNLCREIKAEVIGERPCGGEVDAAAQQALVDRAKGSILRVYGKDPSCWAGSTDCNIPLSLGVPAICFGAYEGGGGHTRGEWINLASIPIGFEIVLDFVSHYFTES